MKQVLPGDIIIESGWHQAKGFAGIVMDHGRIVSNSSQGVQNNSSLVEIQRAHLAMAMFRYIGVQKFANCSLANDGYNPDEPRIPGGQTGGGQWTTGGGRTTGPKGFYARKRKFQRCADDDEETDPILREDQQLRDRLENFRELTPEEKEYQKNEAEAEKMAKKVADDLEAEEKERKPARKPQSLLDSIRQIFGGKSQQQPKEGERNIAVDRQKGVAAMWRQEAENIRSGKPSRNWTPEQESDILDGRVPKSVVDGKPIEGAHIEPVKDAPEKAADPSNVRPKSFTEHRASGGGEHSKNPKQYDTGPTTTP
jgi:hypothetical protein